MRLAGWFRQSVVGGWLRRVEPVLYAAASLWRKVLFRTTFVAITGSFGKTTAKECLAHILEGRVRVFKSVRNQNHSRMVALNLLRVRPWHSIAVFEAATNSPGRLAKSSRLLRPDIALIVGVGRSHLKSYESMEQLADEKWQLLAGLKPGGTLIFNSDDRLLAAKSIPPGVRVVRFGTSSGIDFQATEASAKWPDRLEFKLTSGSLTTSIRTRLVGTHWLPSILGAIATAVELGVPIDGVREGILRLMPFASRMQPVKLPSGAIVIRDEYNGSIDAYQVAFEVMREARATRRVLVLSDCSESPKRIRVRQRDMARQAASISEMVVFVGEQCHHGVRNAIEFGMPPENVKAFLSTEEAAQFLLKELRDGDLVLVKGRMCEHLSRLTLAQFGHVKCWLPICWTTNECDFCWKLGLSRAEIKQVSTI